MTFTFTILIIFSQCFSFKIALAQTNMQDLVYQPPLFGIKINYPPDWKVNSDDADPKAEKTTIATFLPKINSNITDGAVKLWVDNNPLTFSLQLYMQNEINNKKKDSGNFTENISTLNSILSNNSAFVYNYKTITNGIEMTYQEIGTLIGNKVYELTYFAQSDKFLNNLDNAYRIINSFQVLPTKSLSEKNPESTSGICKGFGSSNPTGINVIINSSPINQENCFTGNQTTPGTNNSINTNSTSPSNRIPIANAGIPQEVNEGDIVLLNGSQSYDPDNDSISYSWTQLEGPNVTLDNATTKFISFFAPNVSSDTLLKFLLTVKDSKGFSSIPSNVTVLVKPTTKSPSSDKGTSLIDNLTYTNPSYGISINYPTDWIGIEGPGKSAAVIGDQTEIITFVPSKFISDSNYAAMAHIVIDHSPKSDLNSIITDMLSEYKNGNFNNVDVLLSETQNTLAGRPSYTLLLSAIDHGHPVMILEHGILVGKSLYYIQYEADLDKYGIYLPIIQNMLKSLEISQPFV